MVSCWEGGSCGSFWHFSTTVNQRNCLIYTLLKKIKNCISFNFPDCQFKLFTNQEWLELRKQYRPVGYNTTEYGIIRSILQSVFQAYRQNKTYDTNWVKMYKEAKKLEKYYDPVLSSKYADIAFCIFFVMQVLSIMRYNPGLFDTAIDSSEWDFVVKFWGRSLKDCFGIQSYGWNGKLFFFFFFLKLTFSS